MTQYYAIKKGLEGKEGIYHSWNEMKQYVLGISGSQYKKFPLLSQAKKWLEANHSYSSPSSAIAGDPQGSTAAEEASPPYPSSSSSPSKLKCLESFDELNDAMNELDQQQTLIIYTDGSCMPIALSEPENPQLSHSLSQQYPFQGELPLKRKTIKLAGCGVYFGDEDERNISKELKGEKQTNQRAEIYAVILALEHCLEKENPEEIKYIEIRTDSMYVINAMCLWVHTWIRCGNTYIRRGRGRGTLTSAVDNGDLFTRLYDLIQKLKKKGSMGQLVKFTHIKAHRGEHGNEAADQLAKNAVGLTHLYKHT